MRPLSRNVIVIVGSMILISLTRVLSALLCFRVTEQLQALHAPSALPALRRQRFLKRLLDLAVSTLALILLLPLFGIVAFLIRLTSPGPIFYRATRVGQNGKPFQLYKFRSMVTDADKKGPGITIAQDPRVTPVGRFLRKTKMDELPQFLNVFRGEMSLVGPRPEDPRYVQHYTPEQWRVLDVKPGITSPASVQYRHEEALLSGQDWESQYLSTILPTKLKLDLDYALQPSIGKDIQVLLQTVRAVLN